MPTAPQHRGRMPEDMAMVPVPSHVLDLINRITNGDELWRGDASMGLYFDAADGMYRVIGLDIEGKPYVAATSPVADLGLIRQLVDGDWQRGNIFDAVEKANAKARADLEAAEEERLEEMADRLTHAIRKDFGYRDMWAIDWKAQPCSSPS